MKPIYIFFGCHLDLTPLTWSPTLSMSPAVSNLHQNFKLLLPLNAKKVLLNPQKQSQHEELSGSWPGFNGGHVWGGAGLAKNTIGSEGICGAIFETLYTN